MRSWVVAATCVAVVGGIAHAAVEDELRDGDKYFDQGNWARAAAAYDRAIGKAPGQVPAGAYGKRAAIFIIIGDYDGGLAFVARVKARSTTLATAPALLEQEALLLWETGRRDDAIAIAERVVAVSPTTFTNQKLIGEWFASRDPARAAIALEAYLAHRPRELESGDVLPRIRLGLAHLSAARAAIAASDEARARARFTRAVEQFELVQRRLGKRPGARLNAANGLCAAYTGLGRFDEAVTVCERVTGDGGRVDATGAAWFNLGTAYLARRQTANARRAAVEFTKVRKSEARGYKLLGDTFYASRDWGGALEQYLKADKLLKAGQVHDRVQLSIQLGKTYRRLPAPASGPNPNLALAIDKLDDAARTDPTSVELAIELGSAYLAATQDDKAGELADRMIGSPGFASAPPDARANTLVIAGKARFNQQRLKDAAARFEAARKLRPNDITIQRALVGTINEQAFGAAKDARAARALLEQALTIDPTSTATLTNLAVLALERGDCDEARTQLTLLATIRGHDQVTRARLLARSYLCPSKRDATRAAQAYATAERAAKAANAAFALAEVYTEWAPLLGDGELDKAVEMLELATQTAAAMPAISAAARRNLTIVLFRRGAKRLRDGRATEAAADFERASREPSTLVGDEPLAFGFAHALATLEAGRAAEASRLFRAIGAKGNQAAYLKGPYARVGGAFFAAYASYRTGTTAARQKAAIELTRLRGDGLGSKLDELISSAWELVAHDQWRTGQRRATARSLTNAARYASGDLARRVAMDEIAIGLAPGDLKTLETLAATTPEALVNIGILHDRGGRPRAAFEAWQRARARGVVSRDLQRWIDAKRRIYGY